MKRSSSGKIRSVRYRLPTLKIFEDVNDVLQITKKKLFKIMIKKVKADEIGLLKGVIEELIEEYVSELQVFAYDFQHATSLNANFFWLKHIRLRSFMNATPFRDIILFLRNKILQDIPVYPNPFPQITINRDMLDTNLTYHIGNERSQIDRQIQHINFVNNKLNDLLEIKGNQNNCYLISKDWFDKLNSVKPYTNANMPSYSVVPGPIDNSSITEDIALIPDLCIHISYFSVSEIIWRSLIALYGIKSDSISFRSRVVTDRSFSVPRKVPEDPIEMRLYVYPDDVHYKIVLLRAQDTIQELILVLKNIFNIPYKRELRIHKRYLSQWILVTDLSRSARQTGLEYYDPLFLEVSNEDRTWSLVD